MIKSFRDRATERLWMGAFVKRFSGIERQALRKLDMLHSARELNDLRAPPANRLEVLNEEFLRPLGMSVNALAMALRVPTTRIGAIVKGERSVTADTALRLARFFGTSPEFWINLRA